MAAERGHGSQGLAWAGILLATAGIVLALLPRGRRGEPSSRDDADLADPGSLEGRVHDLERRAEAAEKRLAEAETRLAAAQKAADEAKGEAARAADAARSRGGPPVLVDGGERPAAGEGKEAAKGDLADILRLIETGGVPKDQLWKTLERARELGGVDDAVKALEKYAADHPQDAEAQYALGTGFLQKLLSVPDGPERGKWSTKAIASYDAALKIEPEHWEARFSKAMNYSQWPDFTGMQPVAIKEFEALVQQQEKKSPEAKFVQTYFQLGNTYRKAGNVDKAREAFQRGLALFPNDENLKQQLELLDKR